MGIFSKECIGVDIGVSSIKVVELSRFFKKDKLLNYAVFQLSPNASPVGTLWDKDFSILVNQVSSILKKLLQKSKIRTREVFFALPDFSTFFSTFELPPTPPADLPQAISFEARHRIPMPLSDVDFDWQIINNESSVPTAGKMQVLLVAVPKKIVYQYQKIALLLGLKLKGLEAEVFSLARASGATPGSTFCLVDIGFQTTTVSIVKNESIIESHSFDVSSRGLNAHLAHHLGISLEEAEKVKRKFGFGHKREDVFKIISSYLNSLCKGIDSTCEHFYQTSGEPIKVVKIAGGASLLSGLPEYLQSFLKRDVSRINPFLRISYPPLLRNRLITELGPSLGVALGVALRGIKEE